MRTTTLLVAVALLGFLVAAPTASAGHMGPCTHEYVDYYKEIADVAPACAMGTVHWVLDLLGIQIEWPL